MLTVRQKMSVARGANRALRLIRASVGLPMTVVCRRRGILWRLDLDEGIDLSIYLLGAYEPSAIKAYSTLIKRGSVVFDVGANIGAHTLHFANLVGANGKVYAFEPTDYAIGRLRANVALNPGVSDRVVISQSFLAAESDSPAPALIVSRWPVGLGAPISRQLSCGAEEAASGAVAISGDEAFEAAGITRLDFIKIDVDGNEFSVLVGLRKTILRLWPTILIELAPYIYGEQNRGGFDRVVNFLAELGYCIVNVTGDRIMSLDPAALRRDIVSGCASNCILRAAPGLSS